MRIRISIVIFSLFLFSVAIAKYLSVSVTDGGSVFGKVTYAGKAALPKKITPTTDKSICGVHGPILSEDLVVDSLGGVKNVVVTLTNITSGKPMFPIGYAILDQEGCVYRPHVLVVPVGQKLKISNKDGIIHNIHSHSALNPPFNFAQPGTVKEIDLNPFTSPELIKVTCDVHNWMSGYIWVTEHPYTVVAGEDGSYEITEIPAGKYKIEFWHETLGKLSQEIKIENGKATKLDIVYPAKEKGVKK